MQAPYETNLKTGDLAYVEFVPGDLGNNVRSGPGTGNTLLCSAPVGRVVHVVGGPRYTEGMIWWQVFVPSGCGRKRNVTGWTSEGTTRARWLRAVPPLRVVQGRCRAPLGTRLAVGERAYVQDPTGRDLPNVVRESPGRRGVRKGTIPVGDALRVLRGPVCRDGMAWWKVRTEGEETLRGWTSEGEAGEGFYLVPLEVRRNRPEPVSGGDERPRFRGDVIMEPDEDVLVVFSPDGEVVTVIFSDMIAQASNGSKPRSKSFSMELPVNSRTEEVKVEQLLVGYVSSYGGARGVLTVEQGERRRSKVWPRGSEEEIDGVLKATLRVVPSLSTALSVEIEQSSTPGDGIMAIDMMDITLLPPHPTSVQARG